MTITNEQRTLAQKMADGRLPVPEALHYAMSLAESLRKLHDAGKAHGAVTPSSVVITATGVDLIPSLGPPATATPYTAPEVVQGTPADARSDIFSFGALLFEMLTGRRAFDGEGQTALTMALCNSAPPPSGSPAVDRLVAGCVAKSPAARWQRMQKIIMELKLLSVAARRADAAPPARGVSDGALRSEIQQLEARLAVRLASHEKSVAEKQAAAGQTIEAFREQLAGVNSQIAAVLERSVEPALDIDALTRQITAHINESIEAARQQHTSQLEEAAAAVNHLTSHVKESVEAANQQHTAQLQEAVAAVTQQLTSHVKESVGAANQQHTAQLQEAVAAVSQQLTSHVKESIEAANQQHTAQVEEAIASASQQHAAQVQEAIAAASQKHVEQVNETVAALNQRMGSADQNMEEIRKHFSTLQSNVAADLHDFEQALKSQSVAIESARTAMAQTDDLVERVVEALELLQSSVLDQHEAAAAG
jgi:chromosome segregation ATPase